MSNKVTIEQLQYRFFLEKLRTSVYPIIIVKDHSIRFANEAFECLFPNRSDGLKVDEFFQELIEHIQFKPNLSTLIKASDLPIRGKATVFENGRLLSYDLFVFPVGYTGLNERMFWFIPSQCHCSSEISNDQLERLASLGQISTIIAHEIRNPLGSIRLNLQYLSQRIAIPEAYKKTFKDIEMGIYRIEKVIQSILDYTRPQTPEFQPICLHEVLNSRIIAFQNELNCSGISLRAELGAERTHILGDPNMLDRVFANLMSNAYEAIDHQGSIEITTGNQNQQIWIKIRDTGRGILPEILPKIYDPFFTAKSEGVGIGLAIVKRILDLHRAEIQVESRVGNGTTFLLKFSVIDSGES
ncbi:MAG: ATP-binding protein [candidate division KSB1 bacterium]|nr:ATP-binding protein [candidate division KSB1 bacterium]